MKQSTNGIMFIFNRFSSSIYTTQNETQIYVLQRLKFEFDDRAQLKKPHIKYTAFTIWMIKSIKKKREEKLEEK